MTYATLNPLDKASSLTLSGGDVTVVRAAGGWGWGSVRSTIGKHAGKWYFEITNNANGSTDGDAMWGFTLNSDSLAAYPGSASLSAASIGWQANCTPNSARFQHGALGGVSGYGRVAPTQYASFAIDLDAGKLWVRNSASVGWAGGGDPASGTSPTFTFTAHSHLCVTLGGYSAPQSATINFGASAFAGVVPSGFNSGWYSVDVPAIPPETYRFFSASATDAQGVATDGESIFASSSTLLSKHTKSGIVLASRNVSADPPIGKGQINGLCYRDGVLYASAATFSGGVGSSWICFHATKVVAKVDPATWMVVATVPLTFLVTGSSGGYGAGTGYDGIAWFGDYLLCNIHEIYDQHTLDVYYWNGTTFEEVARLPRFTAQATQGLAIDPIDNSFWFAERNYSGNDSVATSAEMPDCSGNL